MSQTCHVLVRSARVSVKRYNSNSVQVRIRGHLRGLLGLQGDHPDPIYAPGFLPQYDTESVVIYCRPVIQLPCGRVSPVSICFGLSASVMYSQD